MHGKDRRLIQLTCLLVCSIVSGTALAGTYIYYDEDGKEVRDLPKTERAARGGARKREAAGGRRRTAGETPARGVVDASAPPSSRAQR